MIVSTPPHFKIYFSSTKVAILVNTLKIAWMAVFVMQTSVFGD